MSSRSITSTSWLLLWPTKPRAILQPGNIIALHNTKENRFVRLNGNNKMDASTPKDFDKFPDGWKWEKFVVVDGG